MFEEAGEPKGPRILDFPFRLRHALIILRTVSTLSKGCIYGHFNIFQYIWMYFLNIQMEDGNTILAHDFMYPHKALSTSGGEPLMTYWIFLSFPLITNYPSLIAKLTLSVSSCICLIWLKSPPPVTVPFDTMDIDLKI